MPSTWRDKKRMLCPFCSCEEIKVIDSRDVHDGRAIRRRRQCIQCNRRFTTYEEVEVLKVCILKRDGSQEDYNREKMRSGLEKACEKRPISSEQIEKILSDIEYCIHAKHKDVVKSKDIGKMILQKTREA